MIRFVAILLCATAPAPLLACACCADPGYRSETTLTWPDPESVAQALARADTAHLYMSACGAECVTGIENPDDSYALTHAVSEGRTTLALSGSLGSGTLTLHLPATATLFKTDPIPEPRNTTSLYTEFRLDVAVTGTGAFETRRPLFARLVFSGMGNHCMDITMTTHWSLSVDEPNAEYRLFGPLID